MKTILFMLLLCAAFVMAQNSREWLSPAIDNATAQLVEKYGEEQRASIERGLKQVADFWREEDGSAEDYIAFALRHYAGDQTTRDAMFNRYQYLLEQIGGHMNSMILSLRRQTDEERGPIYPFDELFAAYNPAAHVNSDLFENKLAFIVLLNFPLTTLEERLANGAEWTRRQWAEVRLAQDFGVRVPSSVNQAVSAAAARADQYIAGYNIWMHHLIDNDGQRLFPEGLRLLSHWNLRDEIKAQYARDEQGLKRQRMIQKVMERIVDQTIPEAVIDNPHLDWNPYSNTVKKSPVNDSDRKAPADLKADDSREPDTRYDVLLGTYLAARQVDAYSPTAPTHILRRFEQDREIPEERVRKMLENVLESPLFAQVGQLIGQRLGRELEPFDIWYNGFKPRGKYTEQELDKITRERYPTAQAFHEDIARILTGLDFSQDKANYLAANIEVDPARGSGHAWGPQMRSAPAHLRTRVGKDGMDYKGYNIAVHELGHNVEQIFSLKDVDYTLLEGVPNTAFTEALAFVFQNKDLELLGLSSNDPQGEALNALNTYWGTCEIGAVALVDMEVWHWMYDHPQATPAELRQATLDISKKIWNRYFADVFGKRDVTLLGIYSHMIHSFLYLPDYPIGHMIALQIEEHMREAGEIGPEFERMTVQGRLTPDLWMKGATGKPVGPDALLSATENALKVIKNGN